MKELLFGTAGIPTSTKDRNTTNGVEQVRKLGLGAMELEFVHSINISKDKAPEIAKIAKEQDVVLTCHAPYYINLNAEEKSKIAASMKRIADSARTLSLCGGWSVCFHPGYYMKTTKEKAYEVVKKHLKEVMTTLKKEGIEIWVRPETTGRPTAFGDVYELIKLSSEIEHVLPCIDFSHLHARSCGKFNTTEEFNAVLIAVEKQLGKEALNNMHIHLAGINYGDKGELNHLNLKQSDMNYKDLVKAWKDFKIKGVVISESPNIEKDAQLLQGEFT
ncbi:TIM barrel protein [Candidatus Woesearchaeota archaeon]|nr:TIM barrel protein [Candidatus Woesearchaeota archaeon]